MNDEFMVTLSENAGGNRPAEQDEAFALALHQHADVVIEYLTRHLPADLRRVIEPIDIAQDTFYEAASRAHEFAGYDLTTARRWLVTIARNRLIDTIRTFRAAKRGGGRLLEEEVGHSSVINSLQELATYRRTPSQSAARREWIVVLQMSLDHLAPNYRDILNWRYIEGLSVSEAAARIGSSEGAVRVLCRRALKSLRLQLRSASAYL